MFFATWLVVSAFMWTSFGFSLATGNVSSAAMAAIGGFTAAAFLSAWAWVERDPKGGRR